jgi:transcriptional regulator with XRE-family HTH domain
MPALVESRLDRHRQFDWNAGVNIRYLRILHDIEQKTLAKLVDMDVSQLSRVENGLRSLKFKEGLAIAKVFGVKPERLTREIINTNESKNQLHD